MRGRQSREAKDTSCTHTRTASVVLVHRRLGSAGGSYGPTLPNHQLKTTCNSLTSPALAKFAVSYRQILDPTGGLGEVRLDDRADECFQIILLLFEVLSQLLQQLRARWRIGRAEIIHRIDNATTEETTPHAVDRRLRKIGLIG